MDISLKTRLSLIHLFLLAVLLSVFSYGIFYDTKRFLVQSTVVRLRAQAKPVIDNWIKGKVPGTPLVSGRVSSLAVDLTSRDTAALILDKKGNILAEGKRLKSEPSSVVPDERYFERSLNGENDITYITEKTGNVFLVVLIPIREAPDSTNIMGVVQLSTPLKPVYEILIRQKRILILGIIIIVTAGAVLGFMITSVSLKELTGMVGTCNQIADGNLDSRINLPKRRDEIGQVANAFDNMISRIEELFNVQTRFIANAAHELRTPMTSIQGSLEVLMRGAQDDPQSFLRLTQGMYREVTRLNRMCEQLLDLSRINRPLNIHKKRFSLRDAFNDFFQYAELMADGRKVILEGEPDDLYIFADPDSIKQVFFNLTDNSIQHTGEDGIISFSWELAGSDIIISVSDNGCGISPEDIPHIFEPFYRGDPSRSRKSGGTGLGLAIVKSLVEANGGNIEVKSIVDKGTEIIISFPDAES